MLLCTVVFKPGDAGELLIVVKLTERLVFRSANLKCIVGVQGMHVLINK